MGKEAKRKKGERACGENALEKTPGRYESYLSSPLGDFQITSGEMIYLALGLEKVRWNMQELLNAKSDCYFF